jgi:hypothetical protein
MKLLIMQFLQPPVTSPLFGPNILSALFSNVTVVERRVGRHSLITVPFISVAYKSPFWLASLLWYLGGGLIVALVCFFLWFVFGRAWTFCLRAFTGLARKSRRKSIYEHTIQTHRFTMVLLRFCIIKCCYISVSSHQNLYLVIRLQFFFTNTCWQ